VLTNRHNAWPLIITRSAPGVNAVDVAVRWLEVGESDDPRWHATRVLYAYVDPDEQRILYLGLAGRGSVLDSWLRDQHDGLLEYFREIGVPGVIVLAGYVTVEGIHLTEGLLADVESLLVRETEPPGNTALPETTRPGLRVRCSGLWPLATVTLVDHG